MAAFIILCFMVLIWLGIVAYWFASEKKTKILRKTWA